MSAGHGATGRRDRNGRCKPGFHASDRDVNPKPSLTGESVGRKPEGTGETNRHQKRRNREKTASSQGQGRVPARHRSCCTTGARLLRLPFTGARAIR
ncbi:hypothetical protein FKH18_25995 [Salmonella enterica]|uniref:Uncharacterized protein n=1 Tax=Salmonella enterica TaxID=28901 RepID=A0A619I370_SALER|nr:hypothetical protein [Salmonella enterica]EDR7785446.1 hypothetical protein [Salmonella enterica subsp. enterica serovar Java]EKN5804715.1 hypothetical protein [Salmonella enterica subsp. enterica]EAV7629796.1 hypothetical protein [Salmonella enterica]EBC0463694.1 hypothetical protein [Salmonella enterica]